MNKRSRNAVILPLIGLNATWVIFWFASYAGHLEDSLRTDGMGNWLPGPEIRASSFLFLAGIAVFAIIASMAQHKAEAEVLAAPEGNRPAQAAFRFASLAVIIALVAGAIYAIGTFMGSFDTYAVDNRVTLVGRLVGTYLPIVLATILEVFVLLRATVFRKSSSNQKDEGGKMTKQQRGLVLGYSLPIVATALGIIIGLAFWDIQGQSLDAWVWVLIQALIAGGIVLGTRFAVASRSTDAVAPKPRTRNAAALGAVNLNFVLSIVFGGVVSIMSFAMAADSVGILGSEIYRGISVGWFIDKLLPAYVLLFLVTYGLYATIVIRNQAPATSVGGSASDVASKADAPTEV